MQVIPSAQNSIREWKTILMREHFCSMCTNVGQTSAQLPPPYKLAAAQRLLVMLTFETLETGMR